MKSTFFITFLAIVTITGCSKHKDEKPLGAGLFLSCDLPPHMWYPFKDFLKAHHIKITFYTEGFHALTQEDKQKAKEMIADGHEIAHHTSTHPNLKTYLESHTVEEYINNEIIPMKNQMEAEGFSCNTFAYPHGVATKECDKALLQYFSSVRKLYDPNSLEKLEDVDYIYYRYGQNEILFAASIDKNRGLSMTEMIHALEKAKKSKQTISLYCHYINFNGIDMGKYSIDESDIKTLLTKASELNLKSYTASEISKSK